MKLKATFCLCDTPTAKGRMYEKTSMLNALEEYKKNLNNTNAALGELEHNLPERPFYEDNFLCDTFSLKLENASHIVENIEYDGCKAITGEITLLNTQSGNIVSDMIADGLKLYMQPRTLGVAEGDKYMTDAIVSFDITASCPFKAEGIELQPIAAE